MTANSHSLRITILGSGSSGGVPRVGGDWGYCDPAEPKNRRSRCSILVEQWLGRGDAPPHNERTVVLIDTSPDLRQQLLDADVTRIDALLYTHDHADQSHGIDDMRAIAYRMRQRIPTYMDAHTKAHVFNRFEYCFEIPEGRVHPAILELQPLMESGDNITIGGPGGDIAFKALALSHGPTPSMGFVINGRAVYTPDVHDIASAELEMMGSPDVWIVDALRYSDHPSHAHVDKALRWIAMTRTRHAILTNLHIDLDYATLSQELTDGIEPAYDGMVINL